MLFRSSLVILCVSFGLVGESTIRVSTLDRAQCLVQCLCALFQQWLDCVDECLLVQFVRGSLVGLLDMLRFFQSAAGTQKS